MSGQAIKDSSIVFLFGAIAAVAGYATRIFLSRSLSVEDFGLFYSALAVIGVVNIVKDLGTNAALIRFIPEFVVKKQKNKIRQAFYTSIFFQIVVIGFSTVLILVYVDTLSSLIFDTTTASTVLVALIFSALFSPLFVASQSTFQGLQKMKKYALIEPFRILSALGIMAVLIFIGFGVSGAAFGYMLAAALTSVVFYFLLRREFPEIRGPVFSSSMGKQLLNFGAAFLMGSFASYVIYYADTIIITLTRSLTEVGYYQAAASTSQMLWMFAVPMAAVLFPLVSQLHSSQRKKDLTNTVKTFSTVALFLVLPFAIIVFSFPSIVLNLFFGPSFLPAADALRILSVGAVFFSIFYIFQITLLGMGKPWLNTKIIIATSVISLIMNIITVPSMGIIGASLASTTTFFIGTAISYWCLRRGIALQLDFLKLAKIFFAAVVTTIFIAFVKAPIHPHAYIEAFVVLVPAFMIYTVIIILTKGVDRGDLDKLKDNGVPVPKIFYRVVR